MENVSILVKEFSITTNIFDPNKNNKNDFLNKLKLRLSKI